MGELPIDARRVVDELNASRRGRPGRAGGVGGGADAGDGTAGTAGTEAPRTWVPSESFESTLAASTLPPMLTSDHLNWLHQNWDLGALLAPPPATGLKGLARRTAHRVVMAVLAPYFRRLQDYLGVNVRAMDQMARQLDEATVGQQRLLGAVRADLIDFAHHVDDRLDG